MHLTVLKTTHAYKKMKPFSAVVSIIVQHHTDCNDSNVFYNMFHIYNGVFPLKGSDTETQNNVNGRAWGVILGIAVTVGVVGLIIYVMQKRKQHRNFSHSKLVEEGHPDPGKSKPDALSKLNALEPKQD